MFCLGMWLRKSGYNPKAWILAVVYVASSVLIAILNRKINTYNYDFVLTVVNAVALFLLYNKLTFQCKAVNFAAKSCFAIFCIHIGAFANTLWTKFFITEAHICNGLGRMILWSFISVLAMFSGCLAVSVVMRGIFGRSKDKICNSLPVISFE